MRGSQEPRIRIEPSRITTDGDSAALLMEEYGNKMDPWQKLVLDCWLGKDEFDNYTTTSAGLSVPRQNGKNVCLEARELFGLVAKGEKILHTAHQVKTSKKSFRRLASIFTDKRHPELQDIVKTIRYTNGEEAIELDNGGSIEFSARSRQAARGFDGISLIVYDEAQELTDDQLEATMATLAASATGTRQIIYTGTPPYPGCPGDVFRRRRTLCETNAGKHDAWHEWSVEARGVEEINAKDSSTWYMTNPALGIHLTEEFTREEFNSMSADGFARERLGWWSPIIEHREDLAIDATLWSECASNELRPEGKLAFGVKFSPDGSEVCLCSATLTKEGDVRISMIERKPTGQGTRWLSEWLCERYNIASCVVIDGRNGVDVLIERIREVWKLKDSVIRPAAKDVVAAAGYISEYITEKKLTWYSEQDVLNDSALTSTKRPIGGGWGFGGDNSSPIEACALALWGVKTSKRIPGKKMRVG